MPRLSISMLFFFFPFLAKRALLHFQHGNICGFWTIRAENIFFRVTSVDIREKRVCPYKAKKCALHALESETESVNSQLARLKRAEGGEKIRRVKERKMEGKLMYAHLGKQQTSPFSSFTSERTGLTKQPKEKRKQKEEEETLFFTQNFCV